jgi:hypothetical protein
MTSTKPVNVRLPEELNDALNKYVQENKTTKTNLVVTLLQQGLAQLSDSSIPPTSLVTPLHPAEAKVDFLSHCVASCLEQQQTASKAFSDRVDTLEDYTINEIESLTRQLDVFKSYLDEHKEEVSCLSLQVESFISTQTALQAQIDKLSTLPTTDSSLDNKWLSTREAHALAQENGYEYGEDAFRKIRIKEKKPELIYAQYGLEFDKERQGKTGSHSKCWRRLNLSNPTEPLPENPAEAS